MKHYKLFLPCALAAGILAACPLAAAPLGTAFTYQGRLEQGGQPATGAHVMRFSLWDALTLGNELASVPTNTVPVTNGLFNVSLDFGSSQFLGQERWLQIEVWSNNVSTPTMLAPRTRVAPTPNAIYASTASTAMNLASGTTGIDVQNGAIQFNGPSYLRLNNLFFGMDASHGIGYRNTYAGQSIDGPVLFGYSGGGLGSSVPDVLALNWNRQGNIGIGTSPSSTYRLDLAGRELVRGDLNVSSGGNLALLGTTSESALGVFYVEGWAPANIPPPTRFIVKRNGYVGIGTSNPQQTLDVHGNFIRVEGGGGEAAYIGGDGLGNDIQVGSLNPTVTDIYMYNAANNTHMHTHVGCLTIHGGCDLAEPFPMKDEQIDKGSVVVIDDEHPGRLKLSTRAYDTQVAGIVSGANGINPGISLKQEGALDEGQNVALTGRVYVKADASHGAIKPGDLLTTSDTPGHAMKVMDHTRAQGAIIGKAMSALKEETGLVLVLVSLQ